MICGVWSKLASVYKDFLTRGHISVVLTTGKKKHGEVSGRILPAEDSQHTETFITVLNPSRKDGTGGVAVMTYHHQEKRMRYRVIFERLMPENDYAPDVLISIHRGRKIVDKSSLEVDMQKSSVTGEWRGITRGAAKQLARGRLSVRLTSADGKVMKGSIMPRQSCGTYQAVLSGSLSLQSATSGAAGAAIISLGENGAISYKIRLVGLSSKVLRIRLEGAPNRKNRRKKIADLTSHFQQEKNGFGGWVNGTYKKAKGIDIYSLLNNKAYINVATENFKSSEIRGHVAELGFREHTKKPGEFPIILTPKSIRPDMTSGTAGNAWFGFDRSCVLHYEIIVEGITVKKGSTIAAQLSVPPSDGEIPVLSNRHSVKTFGGFSGNKAVGEVKKISEDLYSYLDEGRAVIQLASMSQPMGELRGNVTVKNKCWRLFGDHDSNMVVDEQGNRVEEEPNYQCDYEGQHYEDGASWVPDVGAVCNTCSCRRGKVKCHKEVCPVLNCPNPVKVPGQCCASCPAVDTDASSINKNESCYFSGDKRWHPVGASWHPYIPPFGYVTCAVCNCVDGGDVSCSKISCPTLDCPDDVAIRQNEMDCCKVCPTYSVEDPAPASMMEVQSIQGDRSVSGGTCRFAGNTYENGSTWHPHVSPFGIMRCILCECNDGQYKCKRKKCPKLGCPKKQQVPGSCCSKCVDEEHPKKSHSRTEKVLDVLAQSKMAA